jgi:hypothetical protein
LNEQIQAIVTVLSPVNPAICAAMFTQATGGEQLGGKMAGTTKASVGIHSDDP